MVITMAIVGLVASVALPNYDPIQQTTLSLAATSVADAARFAREQSRFYGAPHGIEVDTVNQRVRVFRLDVAVDPPAMTFDVYHPVSRQLYTLTLGSAPYTSVVINDIKSKVSSSCSAPGSLIFDTYGAVRCTNPLTSRFSQSAIDVELDNVTQSVVIDGYHGRVTVL